ncbi:RHS repeat domain-containing protein [Aquimarina sp. MMG016]|uniref:RHS repeat domain-containing protein n=1 Tax=Aquimarina sp. MMG016 TaxID=2822690 RepID=UPI001B39F3DB|nr:RHS repeat domain-containing protein [Aquimarina sp. MMG016]MBQ4822478.1 RHS repeat protein [Aquimarina sp. MMG016]
MKLKLIIIINLLLLLSTITTFSQEADGIVIEPSIPSSPEATSFTRYGSLPLNNATGQMNFTVPIYTIKVGGNSWPINLAYNYGGLKLQDKPSIMGLGWNLISNGIVSREVRGLPDESKNGYYGNNYVREQVYNYKNGGKEALTIQDIRKFRNKEYDSEVDKYTVNVGGLNFSFKIGLDGTPVFLSKHNHKVEVLWESNFTNDTHEIKAFIVTDDKGIEYEFTAIEKTIPEIDEEIRINHRMSWNLTKIKYINDREIEFLYKENTFVNYDFNAYGAALYADAATPIDEGMRYLDGTYWETNAKSTIERQILETITFPGGSIAFNTETINNHLLYTSFQVNDNFSNTNEYNLSYSGSRNLLVGITKNTENYYGFEYYGQNSSFITMPDFFNSRIVNQNEKPLSQDPWGYFNGKANEYLINVPASRYESNRSISFEHTRLGALKKIKYPTGGYTEINYGQNKIKQEFRTDYSTVPMESAVRIIQLVPKPDETWPFGKPTYREAYKIITIDKPQAINIGYHFASKSTLDNIQFKIERLDDECPLKDYYKELHKVNPPPRALGAQVNDFSIYFKDVVKKYAEDKNVPPYICPSLAIDYFPADFDNQIKNLQGSAKRMVILPGRYKFTISTQFMNYLTGPAEFRIQFQEDTDNLGYTNNDVGGIRVSSMEDCPDNDPNNCITRTFNYNDKDGFSTGKLFTASKNPTVFKKTKKLVDGTTTYLENHYFFADRYYQSSSFSGSPVYYKTITEANGVDNGYVITNYSFPIENSLFKYPKVPLGIDLTKSNVLSKTTYTKDGIENSKSINGFQQVRGLYINNTTLDSNENHPFSFIVARGQDLRFDFTQFDYGLNPTNPLEIAELKTKYLFSSYAELDSWFKKIKENTISYYENGNTLDQITDYQYNNRQLIEKTKTTDSNGNTLEQQFEYPFDTNTPIFNGMVQNNQISQPVTIKTLKNDTLKLHKEIGFISIGNGFYPNKVSDFKENTVGTQTNYTYYQNGNIKEVFRENGTHSLYIWGYRNTLPIAKVENATYDQVASYVANLKTKSNADNDRTHGDLGNEGKLRKDLDALRTNLPDAMISTYTYDPLIGVTSMTDPRGYTTYYEYDEFNRLKFVKDADGNLISENKYNYTDDIPDTSDALTIGSIISASSIIVNTYNTFDINPTKGSGHYAYSWTINGTGGTISSFSKSFEVKMDYDYIGDTTVTCKVTDTETGETKTTSMVITVTEGANPLVSRFSKTNHNVNENYQQYRLTATSSGGSGNYTYKWYVDGVSQSNSNEIYIYLDCSNKTDIVELETTDTETGIKKSYTKTYNTKSDCGGGGNQN